MRDLQLIHYFTTQRNHDDMEHVEGGGGIKLQSQHYPIDLALSPQLTDNHHPVGLVFI